jgi:hypothetical protein
MVDSTTQAMMRFRQGNFVTLETDDVEEEGSDALVYEYY